MNKGFRITFNAPITIIFVLLCLGATLLNLPSGGTVNELWFSTYRASLLSPLTYLRFFTYVLGHADLSHFICNMTYLLILGPMLEEKYSSLGVLVVILITTIVTSIINFIFFPGVAICGASGVVFAFILLASFTSFRTGELPLSFVLVVIFFLGDQIYQAVFIKDNISQFGHILGGLIGSFVGFKANRRDDYDEY